MKTIIILTVVNVLLLALVVTCLVFLFKIYKKYKNLEALLNQANSALISTANEISEKIKTKITDLSEKADSIAKLSISKFNNNSDSIGNILQNGGFTKKE